MTSRKVVLRDVGDRRRAMSLKKRQSNVGLAPRNLRDSQNFARRSAPTSRKTGLRDVGLRRAKCRRAKTVCATFCIWRRANILCATNFAASRKCASRKGVFVLVLVALDCLLGLVYLVLTIL